MGLFGYFCLIYYTTLLCTSIYNPRSSAPQFILVITVCIYVIFKLTEKHVFYRIVSYKLQNLQIVEVDTHYKCTEICNRIITDVKECNALGFDCEWVSVNGERNPVALLQLATGKGLCCLYRLNIFQRIPKCLEGILKDPSIVKVGVAPLNDSNFLNSDYNVQVHPTIDLRHLYQTNRGLAFLSASELKVELNKDWRLACSNWESKQLTQVQITYAAQDAFVAIEIFKKWLLTKNQEPLLYFKKNYSSLLLKVWPELERYVDINFKESLKHAIPEGAHIQQQKELRSQFVTRRSPLYHNCFMHAPDGELLCSCDRRKAEWYVERGLADVFNVEPYSIRLHFEPSARPEATTEGRYYQHLKQNCCVVCGASDSYLKHHVVPREYRKHFPSALKDHQSHDIVLMCTTCHYLATLHNNTLRQNLASLFNAPITGNKITQDRRVQEIKKFAKALLNYGHCIPLDRKEFMENKLKDYFGTSNSPTSQQLKDIINLNFDIQNKGFESHGRKIVNSFSEPKKNLLVLEILWRRHFLKTMNPQFLPALWSETHNTSRLINNLEIKQSVLEDVKVLEQKIKYGNETAINNTFHKPY